MLTKVHIHDFRSCHDVAIDVNRPVLALVGRNGAGKTNVLQSINWISRFVISSQIAQKIPFRSSDGNVTINVILGLTEYKYSVKVNRETPTKLTIAERLDFTDGAAWSTLFSREQGVIKVEDNKKLRISVEATCIPALFAILPADSELLKKLQPLTLFLTRIHYYHLDEESQPSTASIVVGSSYDEWLAKDMPAVEPSAEYTLRRLVNLFYDHNAKFEEVVELVGSNGLGLIEDIRVSKYSPPDSGADGATFYVVRFVVAGSKDKTLGIDELSFGTRRVLSLVLSLFDASSVALFEHPEDAIHRGLLVKVVELLRSYSTKSQLIIATHSPAVFNLLGAEDIRLVAMQRGGTTVRALSPRELGAAAKYLQNDGTFSDFLDSIQED